jgi:carboxypeptidase Taq
MHEQQAYDELIRRTREESLLASCSELLGWDELTYMPPRGDAHRGEQMALLNGLYHARSTDPRLGELLAILEGSYLTSDPLSASAVNIREIGRAYRRATRLPRDLVEELARATTRAQREWEIARDQADFRIFEPWLARIVALKQEEAAAVSTGGDAYDALLDEYEPGARGATLANLFQALRQELTPLATALEQARHQPNVSILRRPFPLERQRQFCQELAAIIGFDFEAGRMDDTVHPFCCAVGPGDCRLATRFNPLNLADGVFATLHEVGHGLYEQSLDPAHQGTPMAEVPSLGMHESQSRLWENNVGRSLAFWRYFHPLARKLFPNALGRVSLEDFHFAVNEVRRSPIRMTADEVTYNLHILVRFDLERALISGDLPARDLPGAWSEAYERILGLTPANDAEGCLQDGHWGSGLIGYFPTYTLGNLYAAQLFDRASAELGGIEEEIAHGRFGILLDWLRAKVLRHGHRYSASALVEQATGKPVDHRPFARSLQLKYRELYRL